MEINKILTADILDIIFEGRNKAYGAYELRKTYNHRIRNSLLIMGGIVLALVAMYLINNYAGSGKKEVQVVQDAGQGRQQGDEEAARRPDPAAALLSE